MSIFRAKAEETPAVTVTGRDVLRQALRSRKLGLATIARELGISADALEAFVAGSKDLPVDALNRVTAEIFGGHTEFNPETGLLQSANRTPPIAIGIRPEPFDPKSRPPVAINRGGHVPFAPVKGAKPQPAWPRRAGWAD